MMVVALQMQRTVHHQMRQVVRRATAGSPCFTPHDSEGQHDVAAAKREDVGRPTLPTVPLVQAAHGSVGCQQDRAGTPGHSRRTCRDAFGTWHQMPPPGIAHDDFSFWPRRSGAAFTIRVHQRAGFI